jgi:ribosomal protein L11 methyltransferase
MDWIEITVTTNTQGADIVSEALIRQGAKGTQIIDRADIPDPGQPSGYWELIDPCLIASMPEAVEVKAWFSSPDDIAGLEPSLLALPAAAGFDLGPLQVSSAGVRDEDWAECWKKYYKPFRAGKTLVIKPSWEPYSALPGDKVIELDPGMAFGTGTHETTAMCVELLEKHYRGGKVLDVGTGSGILAIAAARLGASDVLAVDIDPMAVRVADENVRKNSLAEQVRVRQGDLALGIAETFDFALANILADVICMLACPLRGCLKPGAVFVCSGIISPREREVRSALTDAGYTVVDALYRGDWVALAAVS